MATTAAMSPGVKNSELEIVDRHRYGDPEAFGEIYTQFERMVFNLALRLSGDESEAADCTQETFLRVYRYLGAFSGRSSLKTWIFRIAVNCCRSRFRRRSRRGRYLLHPEGEELEQLPDSARGPEQRAVEADLTERVRTALTKVRSPYREAVVLRDLEGLSYEEVAAVLEVRIGTVRSRIARGRQQLRLLLEERR
jgi:RNA polymerase sigma-70 factor (ECF subfamily)